MTKVDLITGFLGSGKTTFLKQYVRYFLGKGQRVGVIENDYGAVNVDMMLIKELMDEGVEVETIAGACDYDCHKRRFKTKLIALGMQGFDRVIIEPSGIFDTDEFFDTLHEEPLDRWYEIGSVITVIDALSDDTLSEESRYLLASQAANAGVLVFSKTQLAGKDKIASKTAEIESALKSVKRRRDISDILITKNWEDFTDADFQFIAESGYEINDYQKIPPDEINYSSVYIMNSAVSAKSLKPLTERLFKNHALGNIFRIKGFINEDGEWLELNATEKQFELKPIKDGQDIIILIGEKLNEEKIKAEIKNVN